MAKVKMIAEMTFRGVEGLIKNGDEFEATAKRADELERNKLAKPKKPGKKQDDGGSQKQQGTTPDDQGNDQKEQSFAEQVEALKTHAEVDAFAKEHGYDVPSKEDAKMDERKAALKAAHSDADGE